MIDAPAFGVSLLGVDGAPGASRGSFRNSISLDQVMAEQVGAVTRFPSLPFMFGSDNLSLSWTRSGSMIPPICSAVKHYQQHFAEDSVEGRAAAVLRHKEDRSLLDGLHAQ